MFMSLDNLWLIPLYPIMAFLVIVLGRSFKLLSKSASSLTVIGSTVLSLAHTIVAFLQWQQHHFAAVDVSVPWLKAGSLVLSLGWVLDAPAMMMLLVVTIVSLLIHIYTHGYMNEDEGYARFYAYLALFNFSMLSLVLSQNLFQMYVFWELVGVSSYLLIGFWFAKPSAAAAQVKAFLMNRVGDFGLLIGILSLLFFTWQWWMSHPSVPMLSFSAMPQVAEALKAALPAGTLAIIGILIFMGPMAKSAQLPLHTWLPDAMEGPTPISALIHAATMVAAGVYLIARMYPIFSVSPEAMTTIAWVGGCTAIVAATIALTQYDIKKALAYSTMSQLGYMVMAMGIGAYSAGLFHLMTHAFFKAMLFLCSGSVIHGCHHEQDMRHMGGLRKKMPLTWLTYLIGTIAITGVLPFAGFWSKDEIIASAFEHNTALFAIALLTAGMTAFYMFRTYFMTFEGEYRGHAHPHESPNVMTSPLLILAIPSVLIGVALSGQFGFPAFGNWVHFGHPHAEEPNVMLMAISTGVGFLGLGLSYLLYSKNRKIDPAGIINTFRPLYELFSKKWYFDELYGMIAGQAYIGFAQASSWFDKNIVDGVVNFSAYTIQAGGQTMRVLQEGRIQFYLLILTTSLLLLMLLLWFH